MKGSTLVGELISKREDILSAEKYLREVVTLVEAEGMNIFFPKKYRGTKYYSYLDGKIAPEHEEATKSIVIAEHTCLTR